MKAIDFYFDKPASCLVFHMEEKKVFVGDKKGNITVIDLERKEEKLLFSTGHEVRTLQVLSNSLYSFHEGGLICLWNLKSQVFEHQIFLPLIEGYKSSFSTIEAKPLEWCKGTFSQDGSFFIAVSNDDNDYQESRLFHFDLRRERIVFEYKFDTPNHVVLTDLSLSQNDQYLATSGISYTVSFDGDPIHHARYFQLWNLSSRKVIKSGVIDCYFSEDRQVPLLFSPKEGQVLVPIGWYLEWIGCFDDSSSSINLDEKPGAVAYFPHQEKVAIGTESGKLLLGNLSEQYVNGEGEILDEPVKVLDFFFKEQISKTSILSLVFSPNGKYLAILNSDDQVEFFHTNKEYLCSEM